MGTNARFLFAHGNGDVRTGVAVSAGTGKLYWLSIFNETTYFTTFSTSTTIFPLNEWVHIELDYRNSDNKFFLFMNGEKVDEETASVFSAPQSYQFYVGSNCRNSSTYSTDGYIDEFLVTEKLLHTEDFTPSTSYSADSDTIALFNCE